MTATIILWIYIVLLVAGGLMGYVKAKSHISLILSLAFAAALSICALGWLPRSGLIADLLLLALLIVFGVRFAKTKKFMPAGLMSILSILTLALRHMPW